MAFMRSGVRSPSAPPILVSASSNPNYFGKQFCCGARGYRAHASQNNTLSYSEFSARCTAAGEQDIRMSFDVALVAPMTFPT